MYRDRLLRAWGLLALFSLASTAVAQWRAEGAVLALGGTTVLLLAYAKARLILGQYLRLAATPYWYRGFNAVLALFMLLLLGLYLGGRV